MRFSVPYNGDIQVIHKLVELDLIGHVSEIYFAGNPTILSSGRRPKIRRFIKTEDERDIFDSAAFDRDIEALIAICQDNHIRANLLLNFAGRLDKFQTCHVDTLVEMGVSMTTVGSIEILREIRLRYGPRLKIQNSVYIPARDRTDITFLVQRGVTVLLIPPEYNHDHEKIREFCELRDENGIELKLMVNEGCLKGCRFRLEDQLSAQSYPIESAVWDYINNPDELRVLTQPCRKYMNTYGIMGTNLIHPDDMGAYQEYNLTIKIVGRSFDSARIVRSLMAYLAGGYSGDLRYIVENFKHSREPVYYSGEQRTSFCVEE